MLQREWCTLSDIVRSLGPIAFLLAIAACSSSSGAPSTWPNDAGGADHGTGADAPVSCGADGDPCCNGTACNNGLTCVAGACSAPATDAGIESGGDSGRDSGGDSGPTGCTPGSKQCSGNGVETCNANGTWGTAVSCGAAAPDCCGGACVDTTADNKNCGGCGHDCQGGACAMGACQILTLASGFMANALAVDSSSVYWVDSASLRKVPLSGGMVTTLSSAGGNAYPNQIAVSAGTVYWPTGTSILATPAAGGTTTTLASGQSNATSVATDGVDLYWFGSNGIFKQYLSGGTPVSLAAATPAGADAIAVDASNVYWLDASGGSSLLSVPIGGGQVSTMASNLGGTQNFVWGLALDSQRIYWSATSSIGALPIGGGTATTLASSQNVPNGIASDGTNVYWVNHGDGTIMRAPAGGGTAQTIASGQGQLQAVSIALDATSVYWTTGNAVQKLAKP